jgi:hypothetical protein
MNAVASIPTHLTLQLATGEQIGGCVIIVGESLMSNSSLAIAFVEFVSRYRLGGTR